MNMNADVVIVGSGASGLFCAINLPEDKNIIIITKDKADKSDSFLAQGGICVLRDEKDYDSYFEDTMRAGHYENDKKSVDIMIRSSQNIIEEIVGLGVDFCKKDGEFVYTKEGAHSRPRILFHEDETGREITTKLLAYVKTLKNVKILEYHTMVDIIAEDNVCCGVICTDEKGCFKTIYANKTVLATGGIGGLYIHSTNFRHLTGDSIAIAIKHGIKLKNIDYIQVHPTTLYSEKNGREFLISESVRGEGAVLLDKNGERFVDELLPRDVVTNAILAQMKKDGTPYVKLSLAAIPEKEIKSHFPNIYEYCLSEGYDITKEAIPVVPSQHYFMGGIDVDHISKTSMQNLYAVGETSCNGVHGKNRLASNSLLESLVFAKRAALDIANSENTKICKPALEIDAKKYENYKEEYKELVLNEIKKETEKHECNNNAH